MGRKRTRQPLVREKLIHGAVLAVVDVDEGGYGCSPLDGVTLTNAVKNAVTVWIVTELRYAGWDADGEDVAEKLWADTRKA